MEVMKPFAEHKISLHIDDGCMGGGKNEIPFNNELNPYKSDGADNDYYDYKGRDENRDGILDSEMINPDTGEPYFASDRFKVFHYCIIGFYQLESKNTYGISDRSGDDICLWKEAIDKDFSDIQKHFIHELGHNLGLNHPFDNDDPTNIYTSMYQGRSTGIFDFGKSNQARDFQDNPIPNGDEWEYVSKHLRLFITDDGYD